MHASAPVTSLHVTTSEISDLRVLMATYRSHSLGWLHRVRLGEIDLGRPARLVALAASSQADASVAAL